MAFRMDFKTLPRCNAKARSNLGLPCRQAALKSNGRCHWHGGKAQVKHGRYTKSTVLQKAQHRAYINEAKKSLRLLKDMINNEET